MVTEKNPIEVSLTSQEQFPIIKKFNFGDTGAHIILIAELLLMVINIGDTWWRQSVSESFRA